MNDKKIVNELQNVLFKANLSIINNLSMNMNEYIIKIKN